MSECYTYLQGSDYSSVQINFHLNFIKIRHEACFIHAFKTITLNDLGNMVSYDVSKYLNWKSTDDKTSK